MKAAVFYETGGPEVFRYEDVPEPPLRADGVLIDVKAVSVQGGDLLHRAGGVLATSPHIVGYQAAGVVREAGPKAERLRAGDAVVCTMGYGSHAAVVSVPERAAYKVPDGLAVELAAGVPIEFATADDCLFEFGHLVAGETVLVHAGAGGVGLAAIQLAKRAGATVIATASSNDRLERLHEFGMDHGVNYATEPVAPEVLRLTDRKGANLVVDPVGGRTLEGSIESLAYRGRISWVGRAGREERPPDIWPLMQKNASITGVFLGAEMALNPGRVRPLVERLLQRVADGELRVVIDRTFPLSEASAAHEYIESRKAFGRVLLVP